MAAAVWEKITAVLDDKDFNTLFGAAGLLNNLLMATSRFKGLAIDADLAAIEL